MPTFLVIHRGTIQNTLRGADPRRLTAAVEAAVKTNDALASMKSNIYSTPGRTLGEGPSGRSKPGLHRPLGKTIMEYINAIIAFLGLYLWSFFSVSFLGPVERGDGGRMRRNMVLMMEK